MNRLCMHCGESFSPCRSVPGQLFCSKPACQQARKRIWQRQKLATDCDYRDNRKSSQRAWRAANSDYMREYRARRKDYVARNRIQQIRRNTKRKKTLDPTAISPPVISSLIVKMDELKSALHGFFIQPPQFFSTSGISVLIVKIDELIAHKQAISTTFYGSGFPGA